MKKNGSESQSIATLTVEHKDHGAIVKSTESTELVGVTNTSTTPAVVIFKRGETINKGDFSSSRIDIGIHVPCDLDKADVAFEMAQSWVLARLQEEVDRAKTLTPSKKGSPVF